MKAKLEIEFDTDEIDTFMAIEAINGFELPWVISIGLQEKILED